MDKYMMIFDDGKINMLVATDMEYDECEELRNHQISPECYYIIPIKGKEN